MQSGFSLFDLFSHFRETSVLFALRVPTMFSGLKNYYINNLKSREDKERVNHTCSKEIPLELFLDTAPSSSTDVTTRVTWMFSWSMMGFTREQNRRHGIGYSRRPSRDFLNQK